MTKVSRKKATYQSGPKKGKLKTGCKYTKSGAVCGIKKAKKSAIPKKQSRVRAGCVQTCASGYRLGTHSPVTGKRYRGRARCVSRGTPLRVVSSKLVCPPRADKKSRKSSVRMLPTMAVSGRR